MANLPEEIIDQVLKRLSCIEDLVRSEAVCKSWQSVVKRLKKNKSSFNHPWLMLTSNDTDPTLRTFYCLSTKRIFNLKLPELHDRRCWGSPHGWLVTLGLDLNISLFNPVSKIELPLPPLPTFDKQYIFDPRCRPPLTPQELRKAFVEKFVLSSSPEEENCIVVAIYAQSRTLAFAKPGDQVWTPIPCDDSFWFQDVLLFKGQFYATNNGGELVVCEINTSCPSAKLVALLPEKFCPINKAYLIELSGDLLLIERVLSENEERKYEFHFRTESFLIYKLDFNNKCWQQIFDIGEYAVFLGPNTSFAVSTAKHSEYERNSIYFSDDHAIVFTQKFCDMGVVNLDYKHECGKTKRIYSGDNVFSDFSRPNFLVPNF